MQPQPMLALVFILAGLAGGSLPSQPQDKYEELLKKGDSLKADGMWADAVKAYDDAWEFVRNGDVKKANLAALRAGTTLRLWAAREDKVAGKCLTEAMVRYQRMYDSGDIATRQLAGLHSGFFLR